MNNVPNLKIELFAAILGLLLFSCSNRKRVENYLSPLDINILGPIKNNKMETKKEFDEISKSFLIVVENNQKDNDLYIETINDNAEIAPYAIEYTKRLQDSLVRRRGMPDFWEKKYLEIKPMQRVEKYFSIYFFSDFDTLHLFFKYKTIKNGQNKSVQVSYIIEDGKLDKQVGMKSFE